MEAEQQAKGYVLEVLGNDLEEWKGEGQDEQVGRYYVIKTRILTRERLEVLKERFEIIAALPEAGENYWNVEIRRRQ